MIKAKLISVAAATTLLSSACFAGSLYKSGKYHSTHYAPGSKMPGSLYLSGGLGYGQFDTGGGDNIDNSDVIATVALGVKANDKWGMEIGLIQLPDIKLTSYGESIKLKSRGANISAKAFMPIQNDLSGFASAGVLILDESIDYSSNGDHYTLDSRDTITTGLFTAGLSYKLNEHFDLTGQALATLKHGDEIPASYSGMIGLNYHFTK